MKTTTNGKIIFEYFPQEYIDLNIEIITQPHPKLQAILGQHAADEIDVKLAQIAAYCEVMMDDYYTFEDRMRLCVILKDRLILLRENPDNTIIVLN